MKITSVETFVVKALAGPWVFCAVRTDEGITGYGEVGSGPNPRGVVGIVQDLADLVVGRDPSAVDRLYFDMCGRFKTNMGITALMAVAGIELALWDIKGKALGQPVYRLLGGPFRDRQRVYWSHLASYRAYWNDKTRYWEKTGVEPLLTWDDLAESVRTALEAGYTAFKTNLVFPGDPPASMSMTPRSDSYQQDLSAGLLDHAARQIAVMREAAGPDVDICLDTNVNFKTEGAIRLARALEPFKLFWLEIDGLSPQSLARLRESTSTPICSGEMLTTSRQYLPYFEAGSMDTAMVDVQYQGFSSAKRVADLAEIFDTNIAPHNFNGHLSTFQSLNLCATVPNVRIMETDPLQVKWRDELFTELPAFDDGYIDMPVGPGWGTELIEASARKYAYDL